MPTTAPIAITVPLPPEPLSAVEMQALYLRRRHRLSPALAGVIAEMAFASSPSWIGRCA